METGGEALQACDGDGTQYRHAQHPDHGFLDAPERGSVFEVEQVLRGKIPGHPG